MSTPGHGSSTWSSRRQKRMGPAPFASFEDLSDEVRSRLESPEDKNVAGSVVRLPGIREDLTPTTPAMTDRSDRSPSPGYAVKGISLIGAAAPAAVHVKKSSNMKPPATPRIDISRASSSSHHDSKDSSPERDIYDTHDPNTAKLGLGFKEDGALDLRSSTEELDFQDMSTMERRRSSKVRAASPSNLDEPVAARKDSQCSDIVLLSISGRTSRLSSIGSQGSNQSRLSNASHISVLSGQSGLSRCSSPHKMLLETSFCGTKVPDGSSRVEGEQTIGTKDADDLEKVLLSRKHDPTEAILAEGILVDKTPTAPTKQQPTLATAPAKKHEQKTDITITVDKSEPESNNPNSSKVKSRFVSESGVEYYYIPLKGPLPPDLPKPATGPILSKTKLREVKSANYQSKKNTDKPKTDKPRCKSATPTLSPKKEEEPKYIRIKLKPDRCYSDEADDKTEPKRTEKPDTLDLELKLEPVKSVIDKSVVNVKNVNNATNGSPKLALDLTESVTPSPSISRRSSLASIFKSKEAIISPDKLCKRARSRSRSKSRDRDSFKSSLSTAPSSTESIDTKSKHKSVLSLFKSGKKDKSKESSNETIATTTTIQYAINPLDSATVRIPLHSPTYYENRTITSSQDSQETVIEKSDVVVEKIPTVTKQSSTSSENIVFSTNLNDNEVFSTKLPKKINGIIPTETVATVENRIIEEKNRLIEETTIEDQNNSSESEKEQPEDPKQKIDSNVTEIERKAIVLQQDSFEDELPYVPTTLPQERSFGVRIVPIKQRTFEIKTCPIDRPRSTTPINPNCLDEYCEEITQLDHASTIEKLKISLPRNESFDKTKTRKKESDNWSDFAGKKIANVASKSGEAPTPPPLPPKGVQKWINFEDIPEKRKAPKRIQTIPSRSYIEVPESVLHESVVYNYVNPDECKCECHEMNARRSKEQQEEARVRGEDEMPLLDDENVDDEKVASDCDRRVKLDVSISDCRSVISDSSVDLSTSIDPHESAGTEPTLRTPFTSDLGLSSNRSSIVSQDDHQSPESPNAFPKS